MILIKALHGGKALTDTTHGVAGEKEDAHPLVLGKVLLPSLKAALRRSAVWFPKSQGLAASLSPQVISMVLVSVGVYARLMKHAGEL